MKKLLIFLILWKFSHLTDDFCAIRRDVLRDVSTDLQKQFNWTNANVQPEMCNEIQNFIFKIISDIDDKNFSSSRQTDEFENLKKQYQNELDIIETSFIEKTQEMEEKLKMNLKQFSEKIKKSEREIEKSLKIQEQMITSHKENIIKYDKCAEESTWHQFSVQSGGNEIKLRAKSFSQQKLLCKVPKTWFNELQTLIEAKVSTSFDLDDNSDCDKKRKWLLKINKLFSEAIKKISQDLNIETFKIKFDAVLRARRQEIADYILQLSQEHKRKLKSEENYLQKLGLDLQNIESHTENLKAKQTEDLAILGQKLLECNLFDLALELMYDVESEDLMKKIFTREYDNSTSEEKAEQIMSLISHIKSPCGKIQAYLVLYDIIVSRSHTEGPIMIEIVNQIIKSKNLLSSCQIDYDQSKFSSLNLSNNPIVNNIIKIWSDGIKIGTYTKIINFNYKYPKTFEEILISLIEKSYTGNNVNDILDFKDQLIWLSHKYMVLNKMLDIKPLKDNESIRIYKQSVEKTANEQAFHGEEEQLHALRRKMKQMQI